jgi:S1-C subfamily serine protease
LLVVGITDGSPAAERLLVGDTMLDFDGHAVDAPEALLDLLSETPAGRQVSCRVIRGAEVMDVTLTVGERSA